MKIHLGNILLIFFLFAGCNGESSPAYTQKGEKNALIPREVLFGNPGKARVQLSPDGSRISYLAPVNGVPNVWVGPADNLEAARPVTHDTERGIGLYGWAYTNDHIIYLQDQGGNEQWQVYSINLSSGETMNLTPFEGITAVVGAMSDKYPDEIVIGINNRNASLHDLYRVDIKTGNMTLIQENTGFLGFYMDNDYNVRFAVKMTPDGGKEIFEPAENGSRTSFMKIGMEDERATNILGFDKTGEVIYMADSRDRNTAALYSLNLKTEERKLMAEDQQSDLNWIWTYEIVGLYVPQILVHPTEMNVQAAAFNYDRIHWKVIDPAIAQDLEYLRGVADGDFHVISRTLDDNAWIVVCIVDNGPKRYYYYDRKKGQARLLFTANSELEGSPLAKMNPAVIKSRDGLDLVSYYTLPLNSDSDGDGIPDKPLPMVIIIHGGPWLRDDWGYSADHQWLANRGYAVLSVNFRGSTGFGKNFTNAGNMEWGRKMQDDLIDAVNWAVERGIADPNQVAFMGGSYSGYAALVGLTFTPETFACGVDICGMSNLTDWIESFPPYWQSVIDLMAVRVGDVRTEEGRKLLAERSPINYVDRIHRPLLIAQGANDPRARQNESDRIVQAMQKKDLPVTYVLYPDEGHGFARPENRLSFYAVAEAFLSQHLGGRFEPIGDDFQNSSITVPVGVEEIPGLEDAITEKG
jgi:dipeptidyl aminopeptidase/acylaminoacyl peptidase